MRCRGGGCFQNALLAELTVQALWFGQGPAILRMPVSLTFRASGPVGLLHITPTDLDRVSHRSVEHMRALATLTELGRQEVLTVVETLLIPGAAQRISATLVRVVYKAAGPKPGEQVRLLLPQSELGEPANALRNLVSRTLGVLEHRGWISVGHRTLTILDPEKVRAFEADKKLALRDSMASSS